MPLFSKDVFPKARKKLIQGKNKQQSKAKPNINQNSKILTNESTTVNEKHVIDNLIIYNLSAEAQNPNSSLPEILVSICGHLSTFLQFKFTKHSLAR